MLHVIGPQTDLPGRVTAASGRRKTFQINIVIITDITKIDIAQLQTQLIRSTADDTVLLQRDLDSLATGGQAQVSHPLSSDTV